MSETEHGKKKIIDLVDRITHLERELAESEITIRNLKKEIANANKLKRLAENGD